MTSLFERMLKGSQLLSGLDRIRTPSIPLWRSIGRRILRLASASDRARSSSGKDQAEKRRNSAKHEVWGGKWPARYQQTATDGNEQNRPGYNGDRCARKHVTSAEFERAHGVVRKRKGHQWGQAHCQNCHQAIIADQRVQTVDQIVEVAKTSMGQCGTPNLLLKRSRRGSHRHRDCDACWRAKNYPAHNREGRHWEKKATGDRPENEEQDCTSRRRSGNIFDRLGQADRVDGLRSQAQADDDADGYSYGARRTKDARCASTIRSHRDKLASEARDSGREARTKMPSALFIHRSVGRNMLVDAAVRDSLEAIEFADLDANTNILTGADGEMVETALDFSSGNTNPDGFAEFFAGLAGNTHAAQQLASFDVLAFKSCYSASQINSEQQLAEYKAHYSGPIDAWIASHPDQRVILISPPPRRRIMTNAPAARRARAFSQWLASFAADRPNVEYLDLFDLLADGRDQLCRHYRRFLVFDQHPNKEGSIKAGEGFSDVLKRSIKLPN